MDYNDINNLLNNVNDEYNLNNNKKKNNSLDILSRDMDIVNNNNVFFEPRRFLQNSSQEDYKNLNSNNKINNYNINNINNNNNFVPILDKDNFNISSRTLVNNENQNINKKIDSREKMTKNF